MQVKEQFPDIAFGEVGKKLGGCCSALQMKRVRLKHMWRGELACQCNVYLSALAHRPHASQVQVCTASHGGGTQHASSTFSLTPVCTALIKDKGWHLWGGIALKLVTLGQRAREWKCSLPAQQCPARPCQQITASMSAPGPQAEA